MNDFTIEEIHEALLALLPGVEWTMIGNTLDGLIYPDGVEPVSEEDVYNFINDKRNLNKSIKEAAIAHARSLGFTDEMIAVMYPGLAIS